MRLISIGSSAQAQIVLNSQYVSGYHAELLQLDNGDMLLVDKGSSNGTFVNGNRIAPEKEVLVTRNDTITIADQTLSWSMIPVLSIPDKDNIKVIKSVGSHYMNAIHVSGNQVSRFHATIKQTKDGKWYICDHSTNGTTVNGVRLPKDQYIRFKKGDSIACAGIGIQNPATGGNIGKTVGIALGACMLVAACILLVLKWPFPKPNQIIPSDKIYEKYSPAMALLEVTYYYKVITPEKTFRVVAYGDDIEDVCFYDGERPMGAYATGFFISENGVLVTNLHVASPWLFNKKLEQNIKNFFYKEAGIAMADIKLEGVIDYIAAIPNGKIYDIANKSRMRVIIQHENTDLDIAILQTMDNKLPDGVSYIPMSNICTDNIPVGVKMFTMGFPIPTELQDVNTFEKWPNKVLQATGTAGVITQNIDKYMYGFDATSNHGASGSPVFDDQGRLIGVLSSGLGIGVISIGYNSCIKAKYIKRLLESNQD